MQHPEKLLRGSLAFLGCLCYIARTFSRSILVGIHVLTGEEMAIVEDIVKA
jgi:hypothetical protein